VYIWMHKNALFFMRSGYSYKVSLVQQKLVLPMITFCIFITVLRFIRSNVLIVRLPSFPLSSIYYCPYFVLFKHNVLNLRRHKKRFVYVEVFLTKN
jgi:hypothetical protein